MRCSKAREDISLDLDGALPPDRAAGLTRHLDGCADCRTYREDLVLGQRLLAVDRPQLPDNFEWRLQLKLNRTLAEAAAQAIHPWDEGRAERGAWWRNFGAAAAVGMAAVLALAMVLAPGAPGPDPAATATSLAEQSGAVGRDRLELERRGGWNALGQPGQRAVSTGQPASLLAGRPAWLDRGWSYRSVDDLRDLARLQAENRQLRTQLFRLQRQLQGMQTRLDTAAVSPLDEGGHQDGAPGGGR